MRPSRLATLTPLFDSDNNSEQHSGPQQISVLADVNDTTQGTQSDMTQRSTQIGASADMTDVQYTSEREFKSTDTDLSTTTSLTVNDGQSSQEENIDNNR